MSVLKINRRADGLAGLTNTLKTALASRGNTIASKQDTAALMSGLESLDLGARQSVEQTLNSNSTLVQDALQQNNITLANNEPGLEAAAVILSAAGDLAGYAKMATTSVAQPGQGVSVVEPVGGTSMGYNAVPALEAFDEVPLREMLDYSVGFNLFAAKQDAFGEAFFKTVIVTPELGGVDVSISRATVFDKGEHETSGKRMEFRRKNLVDAYVDSTILNDAATDLIPVRKLDNSNAAFFVPAAAVAPYALTISGVSVPTAPLAVGQTIDLIGISTYEPLLGLGVMDINDSIDKAVKIESVYIQTAAGKPAIKFRTGSIPRAQFVKGPEGNYRDMVLAVDALLRFDAETVAVDGTAVTELAALVGGDYTAVFEAKLNGTLNVQTGNIAVSAFPLSLRSLKDSTGKEVDTTSGTGADIKAAVEAAKVVGYEPSAKRTNSNRRTVGKRLDTTLETNRYHIPVASPITVQAPHSSNNDAADLKVLIAAARIRNSNNAVTQLLQTEDFLEEHFAPGMSDEEVQQLFPGMGRYLIRPAFEKHTLDMEASINSIKSNEKAADVSAVLITALRDMVYRIFRDSRFQAGLDVLTGGTGELPTVVLGTDQIISKFLIVPGDTRTLGALFPKVELVATQDARVYGKIYVTFKRDDQDGPDPLSFGTHAWIPELVSTVANVSRTGQQIKETQVQPRTLHFVNMPVLGVIEVRNLAKVLTDKVSTPALANGVVNPYLNGFEAP